MKIKGIQETGYTYSVFVCESKTTYYFDSLDEEENFLKTLKPRTAISKGFYRDGKALTKGNFTFA